MKKLIAGIVLACLATAPAINPAYAGNGSSQKASAEVGSAIVGSGLVASGLVVGVAATPVLLLGVAADAVADDLSDTSKASRQPLPLGDETVAGPVAGPAPDQELAR